MVRMWKRRLDVIHASRFGYEWIYRMCIGEVLIVEFPRLSCETLCALSARVARFSRVQSSGWLIGSSFLGL